MQLRELGVLGEEHQIGLDGQAPADVGVRQAAESEGDDVLGVLNPAA